MTGDGDWLGGERTVRTGRDSCVKCGIDKSKTPGARNGKTSGQRTEDLSEGQAVRCWNRKP